jgi:hypothetical protein
MPRKKSPNNNYFHEGIEEAIQIYNKSESEIVRNRLFSTLIYPALSKISEVLYNKIKPTYMEGEVLDIMMDCTCYLTERLFRVKQGKGKAFSYLTVCARNYYIFHNSRAYTGTKKTLKLDVIDENWDIKDEDDNRSEEMELTHDLVVAFCKFLEENLDKMFSTKIQKAFSLQIIDLLLNVEWDENFNERALIRKLESIHAGGNQRPAIRKQLNRISHHYFNFKKEFIKSGQSIEFTKRKSLTPEQIEYCVKNYSPTNRNFGVVGLSKKFNADEYIIRKELSKFGICKV